MIADTDFTDESNINTLDIVIRKGGQDLAHKSTLNVESEKSDSGMEESFLQESTGISEESDEENEILGRKRPKGKKKMVIDDDDSDDNENNNQSGESAGDSIIENDDGNVADKQANPAVAAGDFDKSEDDQQGSSSQFTPGKTPQTGSEKTYCSDDDDDDGPLHLKFDNKDVFEAESSDEEQAKSPGKSQNDESQFDRDEEGEDANEEKSERDDEGNENDEGFDEEDLDPELLKKLKKFKGASKSDKEREKYSRKAKPTAEKMLEIYSESQRLTRDSRVNLPYYEPEEKSLDDFLARASKKKQEYAALRRANDYQKAQIIHEKLSVTPPKLTISRKSSKRTPQSSSCKDVISAQPPSDADNFQDSGLVSQDLPASQSLQASQSSTVVFQSSQETDHCPHININDEDDDELPDLSEQCLKVSGKCASSDVLVSGTVESGSMAKCSKQMDLRSDEDEVKAQDQSKSLYVDDRECGLDTIPSLQKDPSRDLFSSQSVPGQGNEPSFDQSLETDLTSESASQPNNSSPLTSVTVVNETPLSTQSIENSTPSATSSAASGHMQTDVNVTSACISEPETHVSVLQEVKSDSELLSSFKTKIMPETQLNASNASTEATSQADLDVTQTSQHNEKLNTKSEVEETPNSRRKNIMDKLQLQGLSLPPVPKLLGTADDVICFDELENQRATPKNPGVLKLMDRLARHNLKKTPKQAYDVDISIIEKEGAQGQQELKLKSVKYHVQPEEQLILSDGPPGSERSKLKQMLQLGMKKKREVGRQKRIERYQLENEEGFERAEEEYEEEAEMTDDEDENSDEDDDELELYDYGAGLDDDGKDYNPLLDTEAQEDEDEEEEEVASNFNEDSNDFHLNFEVSDEEEEEDNKEGDEEENERELTRLKKKKRRSAAVLSDDDCDDGDEDKDKILSEKQKEEAHIDEDQTTSQSFWSNEPMTPFSRNLEYTQPQGQTKFRRQSSCSPDLYATASVAEECESSPGPNSHNDSHSQSCDYAHSQMLDADGYLKIAQTQQPSKSRISMLAQSPSKESGSSMSIGQIFGGTTSQARERAADDEDDDDMSELIGLCSGKFTKTGDEDSLPSSQNRLRRTQSFEARDLFDEGDDDDAYDPFRILSQDENAQDFQALKQKSALSDSEDEEKENKESHEAASDDESGDGETEDVPKFTGFKDKKRGIRREFLEEEAELSGSEFDSDENVDLAEEDDILEEEEGDREMAGISESKLRDEVGRLHMKQLQDDDDREIMRYKEMYLQDGDLYTDGRGRRRNFRWKDLDNNSQQDMFTNESDDEQEEEDPEETQWRKDRYERDKFLEESENNANREDSQLVKLGQGFLQKKDSFSTSSQELLTPLKEKPPASDKKKFKLPVKGSFLSRGKDALKKIAKVASSSSGGNMKNSRGFVFQSVDEKETQEESLPLESPVQPPKRKAHTPNQPDQTAKKPKLIPNAATPLMNEKPSVKRKNSILHLLD